jgi:L-lysine 2,3-aminomutase
MNSVKLSTRSTYVGTSISEIPQIRSLDPDLRFGLLAAARILPFKTNQYILNELIDWTCIPHDPVFRLNFPQPEMLSPEEIGPIERMLRDQCAPGVIQPLIQQARLRLLQPRSLIDPTSLVQIGGEVVPGLWRTLRETVMVFPMHAQNCFAICTHCLRWMRHCGIGNDFGIGSSNIVATYLRSNREITDVIFTGGDPLMMSAEILKQYIDPLLGVYSVNNLRFSTRSLSWWPYRFTNEADSDDLLRQFERIIETGKSLTIMAHICHARELSTAVVENAIRRIRSTGAVIRCQSPIMNHINAESQILSDLWTKEISLGLIPYYTFFEDGAASEFYFKLPLGDILKLFQKAQSQVTGLARTVRGPVFSDHDNKVLLDDIMEVGGNKMFILKYVQSCRPENVGRVFFAEYDPTAVRFDQLRLTFGPSIVQSDQLPEAKAKAGRRLGF